MCTVLLMELFCFARMHYTDVIMGAIASQITSLTIVYSAVYSNADQRKHKSSGSLAFVRGIHQGTHEFPAQMAVSRKMFPFDDVIMAWWQHHIYGHAFCLTVTYLHDGPIMRGSGVFVYASFNKLLNMYPCFSGCFTSSGVYIMNYFWSKKALFIHKLVHYSRCYFC